MFVLLGRMGARFKFGYNWQVGVKVVTTSIVPACKRSSLMVLFIGAINNSNTKCGYCRVGSVAGF